MKNYDYVIVGAGSAGCVLAHRLSEKWRVCLVEAGPSDWNPLIHIPFGLIATLRSNTLNWKYWTLPQKNCANRKLFWPRGKTLGGSSSLNAMCYSRGNPSDYDQWEALGNTGWSAQTVEKYFRKFENFFGGANDYHSVNGLLNIAYPKYLNPLIDVFLQAAHQAGYPLVEDFNAASQEGAGVYHLFQKNGRRWSNADAYLTANPNLTILTKAHVKKIIFENKKAIGVECEKHGETLRLHADKEVVLSAGAVGSPQLLMLSGVGDKDELAKHDIACIQHLPGVGQNLQDHVDIHITHLAKTNAPITLKISSLPRYIKDTFQYLFGRNGEFTSNYAQAGGFFKSSEQEKTPDLQWHFLPVVESKHAQDLWPVLKYSGYTLKVCLLHPQSKGQIALANANFKSPPLIDPNYFAVEQDMETLVIGFKKSREVLLQNAFAEARLQEFEPPHAVQTDADIRAYIRANAETIYHPVGTCKMGNDDLAVVDAELKIHGLQNIRVIDASIMPKITSGNTNATVTMIAEKGAEMIMFD